MLPCVLQCDICPWNEFTENTSLWLVPNKFLSHGSLIALYLYPCLLQIFTVHIYHFLHGFGYAVNRLHTCCRGQRSRFEYKEFLEATIAFIMRLLCFTEENYNKPIQSYRRKFSVSALCCGGCVSTLSLREISHSRFISYPPAPGTQHLRAKSTWLFLTAMTSKVAPRATISSSLNVPPSLL